MKKHMKRGRNICALVLSMALFLSMSTVAFAADNTIDSEKEVADVLLRINTEYGTNIHELSESELAQYGLTAADTQVITSHDLVDLEKTLRYIAEVQIPQFERTTQEAKSAMATSPDEMSVFSTTRSSVIATKSIDYATAAVEAYLTTDSYGNTIWGSVLKSYCDTNMNQSTCFIANSTSATRIDGSRTIRWTGSGDYISNINGNYYYLYSGTQYAYMYAADYD